MILLRPLVIFDLETTGPDPKNDRIVELGFIKLSGREDTADEEGVLRINPGRHIPEEVVAIHGISDEDVKDEPSFLHQLWAVKGIFEGADVAGYNIEGFDVPMLSEELRRCGVEWPREDTRMIDAFSILKQQEARTLTWALKFYCARNHENAHSAMADVRATLDVLHAQSRRYKAKDTAEFEEMGRDPSWLDRQGKLVSKDGKPVLTFGKWQGVELSKVDRGYLRWMLTNNFAEDTKQIIREALLF